MAGSPIDYSSFLSITPGAAGESPGLPQQRGPLSNSAAGPGSGQSDNRSPDANQNQAGGSGQASSTFPGGFDPMDYGLDSSAFQIPPGGLQFSMPSFVQGGPNQPWGDGPAFVEPSVSRNATGKSVLMSDVSRAPPPPSSAAPLPPPTQPTRHGSYKPDPSNPVYSLYGSSVVAVDPDTRPFPQQSNGLSSTDAFPPETPSTPFDPASLGLPTSLGGNFPGLYSSSGFDLMGVLARVAARPNPQIHVGPVDTSCAFVVVDARKYDFPIVFASSSFTKLTGYENNEVIGKNCRFIQSPNGAVQQGSKRKYTDSNAVWHMKSHILAGKECQASVINYRKNGTPFINLVTIIPIVWDSDEIAYFVGFQVDLVEQPNAILDKMRDGTYVVNYSLLPGASMAPQRSLHSGDGDGDYFKDAAHRPEAMMSTTPELLDLIGAHGVDGLDDEGTRKAWYRSILDNSDDFIHVLSLKGAFLYVSPAAKRLLEYDESDLVGKSIATICHPSDSIPVMRELKESGNVQGHPVVSLLYRARRKHSGYIWLEAQGKLHVEQGKGRKCVILVGRERPTYRMSWTDLQRGGGLGDVEFWTKLSMEGMCLFATPSVRQVLGFTDEEMVGTAFSQLSVPGAQDTIRKAIQQAAGGQPVSLRHQLKNRQGKLVDVVSNFFPSGATVAGAPSSPNVLPTLTPNVPTVICQTNEAGSDMKRRSIHQGLPKLPKPEGVLSPSPLDTSGLTLLRPDPGRADSSDSGASSAPSTYSAVPSTFKTLKANPRSENDNIFSELETTKTSSWQFELHQLKLTNKRLREELDTLEAARKKRKRRLAEMAPAFATPGVRTCANCGTADSPEWRRGPSGLRELCNACGLRWSKAMTTMSGSPLTSPTGGTVTLQ